MSSQSTDRTERVSFNGRSVLLATDGSPSAKSATCFADTMAADLHARVHVVVVLDIRRAPMPAPLDKAMQLAQLNAINRELIVRWLLRDYRVVFGGEPIRGVQRHP